MSFESNNLASTLFLRQSVGQRSVTVSDVYVDESEESRPDPVRAHLKKVEARNKDLEANEVKGQEAIRKLAFLEAGVPNTPAAKWFMKAYDGDMTSDAIAAALVEASLIPNPALDPVLVAEGDAQQRISVARTVGAKDVVVLTLADQIAAAKTPAELDALVARENAGKSL